MFRFCALLVTLDFITAASARGADLKATVAGEVSVAHEPSGKDWPMFLGPEGTGKTCDTGMADHWTEEGPPLLWRKQAREGYSAPSVLDGKVVLFYGANSTEAVECVRAEDGEPIWKFEYSGVVASGYYGDGPRCTPLLTPTRCYVLGASGKLHCLDLKDGKKIWARDLGSEFDMVSLPFGIGATPILEGELLIVLVGGRPNSAVAAFRAATGELVWQSVGKETWDKTATPRRQQPTYQWKGSEDLISYSSPICATIYGKRQVLCLVRQGLVSLDPQTGKVNFKHWFSSNRRASVLAARPVVIDNRIFLTASYAVGCTLVEPDPSCQHAKEIWFGKSLQAHWSTPVYFDGYIYGFTGREESQGSLVCLDARTGKAVWSERGYDQDRHDLFLDKATQMVKNKVTGKVVPFPFFGRGSLTLVGKRLIILGERGTLALAEPSPKSYRELCRAMVPQVKAPVWPSPVFADNKLYIRDTRNVICLDMSP